MIRPRQTAEQRVEGSNGWMVTLSDLLILLLTFFVLLISMSSMDNKVLKKMFSAFPDSLGVMNVGGGSSLVPEVKPLVVPPVSQVRSIADLAALRKLSPALSRLLDDLERQVGRSRVKLAVVDDDLCLEMASDLLFGTLDASLKPAGRRLLALLGPFLGRQAVPLVIEVYTDNFPLHTERFPDNWVLAAARGDVVARQLQRFGVAADRLSLAAYGPDRPLLPNDLPEHRARNRRLVIRLAGWLPAVEEPAAAKEKK
ncbi:MAG: flagellar motor protein MotB [Deltaproteobacteria bacterium]|nr:flagellar motor protein MotB [Deltaproteobacteria bacterium]